MRKLLLALLILVVSAPAFPDDNPVVDWSYEHRFAWGGSMMVVGGGPPAAGCSTPATGDTFNEGFEGTGYENAGWTETSTPDEDYDVSAAPSTGGCSQGLYANIAGALLYSVYDRGSAIDIDTINTDVVFYLKIVTAPDAGETLHIYNSGNSATPGTALSLRMHITNTAGTITLNASNGTVNSDTVTVVANTWYKITFHYDTTGANSYFQVDAGAQNAIERPATVDIRYFFLGASGSTTGADSAQLIFDMFYINTP